MALLELIYIFFYAETNAALLIELESTEIAVYTQNDMVSRGSFRGFRVHFADDYDGDFCYENHSKVLLKARPKYGTRAVRRSPATTATSPKALTMSSAGRRVESELGT